MSQEIIPGAVTEHGIVVAVEVAGERVPIEQLGVERAIVAQGAVARAYSGASSVIVSACVGPSATI
ncbi:MAG: hypothetical protein KY456_17345 [Chloroflexi bacterium]|nr:hypothetical protein [Chloroflexota bacterium]